MVNIQDISVRSEPTDQLPERYLMSAQLKTIAEHNSEVRRKHQQKDATGIEWPHCSIELRFTSPGLKLLSSPPQMDVKCFECGYTDRIMV